MKQKASMFFLLLVLVLISTVNLTAQTSEVNAIGNANEDNVININDALCVARYSAGLTVPNFSKQLADVDGNGIVNIIDAMTIARYAAGLITQFPVSNRPLSEGLMVVMVPILDETSIK